MIVSARALSARRAAWLVAGPAVALVLVVVWSLRLVAPAGSGGAAGAGAEPSGNVASRRPSGSTGSLPSASVWGPDVTRTVVLQQPIDPMPENPPYVMRVTELEMEPGAKIFEHRQIGAGAHVVVRGSIAIEDLDAGRTATYRAGHAYFEGLGPLHRAENPGPETNRVLMFDLLPAARKFDGTQEFTARGRHNEGELRSGPYAQVPLDELPTGPLMLRVTSLGFGPKAKTTEHTRLGPTVFFVQEGTATTRKEWANSSMTYGTNGYLFEGGREPFILENKPPTPARFLAVELLPASLGDGPSTVPSGGSRSGESSDD